MAAPGGEATAILKALDKSSYYVILGVPTNVGAEALQQAFHAFALEYHPDRYVADAPEMAELTAMVFKRGSEAFAILSNVALRAEYDEGLRHGLLRLVEGELDKAKEREAAKNRPRTLEELATTTKAKDLARKADRLIALQKFEEARVVLTDAVQDDHENDALRARLTALYTAGGIEAHAETKPTEPKPAQPSAAPVASGPRTLEDIATTKKAKELGRRADRLIAVKKFEEARVLLTDAVQDDHENDELRARLTALYTAGGIDL